MVCSIYDNNGKAKYDKEKYKEMILDAQKRFLDILDLRETFMETEKIWGQENGSGSKS